MTRKQNAAVFLVLALAGSLAVQGCNGPPAAADAQAGARANDPPPAAPTVEKPAVASDRVVVYYFHGERRCRTCLGIQQTIEQTVKERFATEAASGKVEYRDINYEQEANKHFAKEFELSFSTMIAGAMSGEKMLKWESCDKVWEYSQEPQQLMDYVAERISAYLALAGK